MPGRCGQLMSATFFAGAALLFYLYAGYPLVLAILAWRSRIRSAPPPRPACPSPAPLRERRGEGDCGRGKGEGSEEHFPSVSVLIAARNEERDIGWKIAETLAWEYPGDKLEVLVASDASDDRTDEIVSAIRDPRLTFIRMGRGGKVRALNRLAKLARGEILFFTDANAHVGSEALRRMASHFADPRVGCVTGDSRPLEEMENPAIANGAGVYWGFESLLKRLESRIGSVLVCDGAIFCARSSLYEPLHPELANDLELPMRIGAAGYWVTHEPRALVFERDTKSPLEEFARRRRMCAQGMAAMLELPEVLRGVRGWQFVSHKFLRWISILPMLMVLAGSAAEASGSAFFSVLLALQVMFYGLALVGLAKAIAERPTRHLTAVPFYVVLGVLGAFVGVVEAVLGKRFDIWEIPILSRGGAETPLTIGRRNDHAHETAASPEGD